MNTRPEIDLDLDLQFLPAWAREPADTNRFAKFEGETGEEKRTGRMRGKRGAARGDRLPEENQERAKRGRARAGLTRSVRGGEKGQLARPIPLEKEEPQLPQVDVEFIPDEHGVESLVRQIKLRGRAYPLFEIAKLILKVPDRYQIRFVIRRDKEGKPLQRLVVCSLDESVWLNEDEIVDHIMRRHFGTFYQTEKVPIEPPKGKYTFVAKCGLSGVILGPPNYHDYQTKLHRLHAERFSHIPFEVYKSKIKIVRDEAAVKQWLEEQSWRVEYTCLNVPEPVRLATREEVEQHFRAVHLPNLVREVEEFVFGLGQKRPMMSRGLQLLLKRVTEEQKRFPLKVATKLSQQFAAQGLQFFKVNRVVHVSVARPHYLDLQNTVVSDNVRRIIEYIAANPNCTRRQLIESIAPSRTVPPANTSADVPGQPTGQNLPQSPGNGVQQNAGQGTTVAEQPAEPTPEQTAVIADLHWLIHQGHIIEFYDGHIELAKPPKPKPQPGPASGRKDADQAARTLTEAQTVGALPENESTGEKSSAELPVSGHVDEIAVAQRGGGSEEGGAVSETVASPDVFATPSGQSGGSPPAAYDAPSVPAKESQALQEPSAEEHQRSVPA